MLAAGHLPQDIHFQDVASVFLSLRQQPLNFQTYFSKYKQMKEASYYTVRAEQTVQCGLCPHGCMLRPGQTGRCRVRRNDGGRLIADTYGVVSALHMDPIRKKPLYRYFPESQVLSLGSYGCNFRCAWCQNADISQCGTGRASGTRRIEPQEIVDRMLRSDSIGLAYTYNEPTVWYEFMVDTAGLVYGAGMKNVVVTNGFINKEPLDELLRVSHAFNVDLKSFSDAFYRQYTGGKLQPVLDTMHAIVSAGLHLEIAFLVIPELNDDTDLFVQMVRWIRRELGKDVVLHINRYFPSWKHAAPPTPIALMNRMKSMAGEELSHVYLGNVR